MKDYGELPVRICDNIVLKRLEEKRISSMDEQHVWEGLVEE